MWTYERSTTVVSRNHHHVWRLWAPPSEEFSYLSTSRTHRPSPESTIECKSCGERREVSGGYVDRIRAGGRFA